MEMVVARTDQSSRSMAQLQQEVLSITSEQERLLDLLLDDMDNPELTERMQSLTAAKGTASGRDSAAPRGSCPAGNPAAPDGGGPKLGAYPSLRTAGIRRSDTRELIEKITVVDAHLVRIKFLEEPDEIDQPIH